MVRRLLPRKPRNPPWPPVICREGHEWIQPPLWWNIGAITVTDCTGQPAIDTVTIPMTVTPPGSFPGSFYRVVATNEPLPNVYIVLSGFPTTLHVRFLCSHTILQLTLQDSFGRYVASQFLRPPKFRKE